MRFGVVSDIHGNLPALLAVVADAQAHGGVDRWLNLGDIVSGPLWPAETADWLMAQGWPTLAGNHERQVLSPALERMGASDAFAARCLGAAHRAWLAALPARMAPAPGVLAVHGTPDSDLVYLLETPDGTVPGGLRRATEAELAARLSGVDATLVLCGHSHVPRDVAVRTTARVVNPGSVGLPAYDDDDHPQPHRVENGSPQARYAWVERGGDGTWQVTLRAVDYDCESAAQRTERNGRGDWADALRTGRVGRHERDVIGG